MSAEKLPELKGKQRRYLKSLANGIKPVVFAGKEGVSAGLIAAIEAAFNNRALLKIRLEQNCPLNRHEIGPILAAQSRAQLIQTLGHTILLFRPDPDEPQLQLPG